MITLQSSPLHKEKDMNVNSHLLENLYRLIVRAWPWRMWILSIILIYFSLTKTLLVPNNNIIRYVFSIVLTESDTFVILELFLQKKWYKAFAACTLFFWLIKSGRKGRYQYNNFESPKIVETTTIPPIAFCNPTMHSKKACLCTTG